MITLGKEGTLHARRQAAGIVRGEEELHKLFTTLADRYAEREGGYTRVLRTRIRQDSSQMAYIEYIDREGELRPARPPRRSFLPQAAQAALAEGKVQ